MSNFPKMTWDDAYARGISIIRQDSDKFMCNEWDKSRDDIFQLSQEQFILWICSYYFGDYYTQEEQGNILKYFNIECIPKKYTIEEITTSCERDLQEDDF